MPIRQTLSPHISTMHFLQKLFQELVHCDRTWRKKKGGGEGTEDGASQSRCHAHVYNGKI